MQSISVTNLVLEKLLEPVVVLPIPARTLPSTLDLFPDLCLLPKAASPISVRPTLSIHENFQLPVKI